MSLNSCVETFTGFGYAKALIFGEYAVMHGAPGLVAALSPKMHLQLKTGISNANSGNGSALDDILQSLLSWPLSEDEKNIQAEIQVNASEFFDKSGQKLGIGSSAAAVVALLDARRQMRIHAGFADIPEKEAIRIAIAQHRKIQNDMGSGLDVIASMKGGLSLVEHSPENPEIEEISADQIPPFVLLATHQQAPTPSFIAAAYRVSATLPYQKTLARLTEMDSALAESVKQANHSLYLEILPQLHDPLARLGEIIDMPIFPECYKQLNPIAQESGVVLKTSGAGGGDIFLVTAKNQSLIAEFISRIPENLGVTVLPFEIAPKRYG